LVPVVNAEDGKWLISKSLFPVGKPGGHGAIWKLAYDRGVLQWLQNCGRKGATVRQVRLPAMIFFSSGGVNQ
jgi:UTP---glucose-1-phosphate uridylyltransferase